MSGTYDGGGIAGGILCLSPGCPVLLLIGLDRIQHRSHDRVPIRAGGCTPSSNLAAASKRVVPQVARPLTDAPYRIRGIRFSLKTRPTLQLAKKQSPTSSWSSSCSQSHPPASVERQMLAITEVLGVVLMVLTVKPEGLWL
jgi:hypothetical protein